MNSQLLIDAFIKKQGVVILDGGLATELENRGHDLNHPLWSARLLLNDPQAITAVHLSYLEAGANCLISSSYQATISGFISEGLSENVANNLIKKTVDLACDARDEFLEKFPQQNYLKPLIAASIGPYGAFLANGAEYRGDYQLNVNDLINFHQPRWKLLAQTPADLFACETIPSIRETEAICTVIEETPDIQVWMSFSCKDDSHIADGTPIEDCVSLLKDIPQVFAIGINCTAPEYIYSLITKIVRCQTTKWIVVYPNSGERFDPKLKQWRGDRSPDKFAQLARIWYEAGARLIGGCCRTGPDHIAQIKRSIEQCQMCKPK